MDNMKPCPFCGENRMQQIRDFDSAAIDGIYCLACKTVVRFTNITMHPNETYEENEEKWRKRWNRRR